MITSSPRYSKKLVKVFPPTVVAAEGVYRYKFIPCEANQMLPSSSSNTGLLSTICSLVAPNFNQRNQCELISIVVPWIFVLECVTQEAINRLFASSCPDQIKKTIYILLHKYPSVNFLPIQWSSVSKHYRGKYLFQILRPSAWPACPPCSYLQITLNLFDSASLLILVSIFYLAFFDQTV